jgi:cysteine desulfurase
VTIYLDHNATTPIKPEARDAMRPFLEDGFGNASSVHQTGQRARKAVEEAREKVARFINAEDPSEIIFTSGGTEASNMAIKGVFYRHRQKGRRMIASAIEHSAVRHVLHYLREVENVDMVTVPVGSDGITRVSDVVDAMTPDTILVSIMMANNETGVIQPVAEIAKEAKKKNILMMTDAVQAAGKIPVDVRALGVDLLTLSAHKFGGPKGAGILYLRKGTQLEALIHGGSQEKNRRGGTENAAAIVGMGAAAEAAQKHLADDSARMNTLRNKLESELLRLVPQISVNGSRDHRVLNTTNLCFEFTDSSAMVMALDLKGIACSNGSACAAGNPEPSHVLLAMGLPQDKAHASLRLSVGWNTTEADINEAIKIIPDVVSRLRQTHPLWKKAS